MSQRSILFALLLTLPQALVAQRGGPAPSAETEIDSLPDIAIHGRHPTGCLATLAPQSMHREPVFLDATMPPHTDSVFNLQADLIAQDVAAEMRRALGARGEDAPIADGKLSWYSVPAQIVVTATRAGEMRWRARGIIDDSSATSLLAHAFDSVRARGTMLMIWPDDNTADSVLFRLTLVAQPADSKDVIYPHSLARVKFTAFFISVPDETPPRPADGQPPPKYPEYNERERVAGDLLMRIVIDSAGRVEPASIHDVWPSDRPRLAGDLGRYYDAFVASVTAWDKNVKFTPARVGVCPVRAAALQPMRFVTR